MNVRDIIFKLLRTCLAALVLGLLYFLILWVAGILLTAFHVAIPAFVAPIVLVIFVLLFILAVIHIWGWNWTF